MRATQLRRYWPPESQLLLLRAILAGPETARAAWRAWCGMRDLDSASWPEVRLLANLAGRLPALDPGSALIPRIQGIRRFVWTQTQMQLAGARPLLAAIAQAGIPMMPLKGAARLADGVRGNARLVRDIDVLVPVADW
ncbi:MAG: nucleotidyltransferase family protein, partial [Proteobacteria bacterium]|nr:nucleotidyltransferase family protein [Pseudomonadota bacterium]